MNAIQNDLFRLKNHLFHGRSILITAESCLLTKIQSQGNGSSVARQHKIILQCQNCLEFRVNKMLRHMSEGKPMWRFLPGMQNVIIFPPNSNPLKRQFNNTHTSSNTCDNHLSLIVVLHQTKLNSNIPCQLNA